MQAGATKNFVLPLIFPKPMLLELELAPDIENKFNRLPWRHRASPSTTLHETVVSTDADILISLWQPVNRFLLRSFCVVFSHCFTGFQRRKDECLSAFTSETSKKQQFVRFFPSENRRNDMKMSRSLIYMNPSLV
jgi:hypothetical protein